MLAPVILAVGLLITLPVWAFDGIRVTLLGGDAIVLDPRAPRGGTLVEADREVLLIDCGPETLAGLERSGLTADDLTALFVTRADSEALAGCAQLWNAASSAERTDPLEIWGPPGTRAAIEALGIASAGARIEAREISENIVYQTDSVRVTAFVAERATKEAAFDYRVEFRQRSVVVAVDNRYSDTLAQAAHHANVLVYRVALAADRAAELSAAVRDRAALFSSPEDAAKQFRAARPGLVLFAYAGLFGATEEDLVRRMRRIYRGPMEIGRARLVVEVENEVQLRSEPSDSRQGAR